MIVVLPNGKRWMEVDTTQPDPLYVEPSFDNTVIKVIAFKLNVTYISLDWLFISEKR